MRTLAIGDIHGCLTALDTLLAVVAPQPEDHLITLGDYVDKGPDSCGVIDYILKLRQQRQLTALRGNHEIMMQQAREVGARDSSPLRQWLAKGGRETLASYTSLSKKHPSNLALIPPQHWYFLDHICEDWWETEQHFFVHANAAAHLPLNSQPEYMLFWAKFPKSAPHYSGKTMICGHTSQKDGRPVNLGYAICIDTWACGQGWLTCLDVDSGKLWQANQKGKVKTGHISAFLT